MTRSQSRRRRFAGLVVAGLAAGAFGCTERTLIRTFPPGATVYVNGQLVGTSPVEYRVPESQFHPPTSFRIEHPDCEPLEGQLQTRVAGSRIFGGIVGLGVPFAFRGAVVYVKRHDFELRPRERSVAAPKGASTGALVGEASGGSRSGGDVAAKLKHLQDLYDRGLISEDEYRATRARLIKGL
jgi:hypothetical protein